MQLTFSRYCKTTPFFYSVYTDGHFSADFLYLEIQEAEFRANLAEKTNNNVEIAIRDRKILLTYEKEAFLLCAATAHFHHKPPTKQEKFLQKAFLEVGVDEWDRDGNRVFEWK